MRRRLIVGLLLALAGCREKSRAPAAPPVADAARTDPNARLDELARQYLDESADASPATATWLGLHGYDDKLDDTSAAAQASELARLRHTLELLEATGDATLDEQHRLDRRVFLRDVRLALYELEELRPFERSPIRYVDLVSSSIFDLLARDTVPLGDRLRPITARLGRVRPLLDEARRNLHNPPELAVRRAIDLAGGTRSFLADTLPRIASYASDERLLPDFRAAQGDAVRALGDFINFLQHDLLPRSHGDLALGKERLLDELKIREQLDAPVDTLAAQLASAGDRELKVAVKRYEEAARAVAPGKSPAEALRLLEDDHPSAEELMPTVARTVAEVLAFARDHRLLTVPSEPAPKVVEMPPYLWGFMLLVTTGPFETHPSYTFYVDPVDRTWDKKTVDEHLRSFHRPQIAMSAINQALARFAMAEAARRTRTRVEHFSTGTAIESGFSRYLDQVVLDEGFGGGDPRMRLVQRREVLLQTCRFVAALRFHALGAKLEDVTRIFGDQADLDDAVARREAERVALDASVFDEALGMLALFALRDEVQKQRGAAFSLAAYHDELLSHGAQPLGLLRRRLLPTADAEAPVF